MASGPTATPECSITDSDLSNAYDALIGYVPAFVSSGIVGMAPYRFSDDPTGLPLKMSVEQALFRDNTQSSLDAIRNFKSGSPQIVLVSSIDPTQALGVTRYIADQSDNDRAVFLASDGSVYAARMGVTGGVNVSALASRYGFFGTDGNPHGSSAYTWFSSCEYYTSNRAQLFVATADMNGVVQNAVLSSADGNFSVEVGGIESTDQNETLFYGTDGRAYAARPDGPEIKIYDRPITQQAPVQPIIYSANGVGSQCSAFETAKMYSRIAVRSNDAGMPYPLTISRNTEERKRTSQLACAGGCLSSSPMPAAFCNFSQGFAHSFPKLACTQYAQMDPVFATNEVDPILLRAIAVHEGALGSGNNEDPKGYGSPACKISKNETSTNTCGSKSSAIVFTSTSNYCTTDDLQKTLRNLNIPLGDILPPRNWACGLGVFQCTRAPSFSYNPFEPVDAAQCGSDEFLGDAAGNRYVAQLAKINRLRVSNYYLRTEIREDEVEWYAAFLALYGYRGMNVPDISNYSPRGPDDNVVKYVVDYFDRNGAAEPEYATRVLRIYNDGLEKCDAACPHNACSN